MLDSFIIEELRKREEQERRRSHGDRPVIEIPHDPYPHERPASSEDREEVPERGVVIIEM